MGGWITTQQQKFIHKEDKCPSNCPSNQSATCASYSSKTKKIVKCSGHRNMDTQRQFPTEYDFKQYGPGYDIKYNQENRLRNILSKFNITELQLLNEIDRRRRHVWYKSAQKPGGLGVESGDLIKHEQENVINDCISALNNIINSKKDYGISHDSAADVSLHKVVSGDIISAENMKYLERNVMASYQDCICYSDCTSHGLSVYTDSYWCSTFGDDDSGGGWY